MALKKIYEVAAFYLTFLLIAFVNEGCITENQGNPKVYPGTYWEERSPESLGVDPMVLDSALHYFRTHSGGVGTDEMVIVKNGYMIWKGPCIDDIHAIYSCTKIFTSSVLGVLVTRGLIKAEDPAVNYFPGLAKGNEGQHAYEQIRLSDFATMTSGYNSISSNCWDLHEKGFFDESYECTQQFTIPGKPKYPPRTIWQYDDQDVHMLGYILTGIAGKSLEQTFKDEVADKIGMTNWDWSDYGYRDKMFFNNPAGTPNNDTATEVNKVQGGIWTSPREFARLGLLYLNKGKWENCQILDSSFVEKAMSNQVPASLPYKNIDLTGRYGFYWWTNGLRKDSTRAWPSAPPQTAAAHGGSMNFCFVIPEWNMVIIRMNPGLKDPMPEFGDRIWEGFFKILKEGIYYNSSSKQELSDEIKLLPSLSISSDNRYLETENKTPVYLLGGTAWTMPENCTREDVDFYLNDIKEKGFNYFQVVAARDLNVYPINETLKYGTMNPENKYGFRPFQWTENHKADVNRPISNKGGSPIQPNDYWDHLEYIIQKAESLGMYIGLLPCWGRYYVNNKIPEMRIFNVSVAKTYGHFLGERFKDYPHILWILGGDTPADDNVDGRPIYRSLAEGLAEGMTGKTPKWNESNPVWNELLITYHGRNASAEYFNEDAWLRLNMVYNDDPDLHGNVIKWYSNHPARPMLEGESWYEGWAWDGIFKTAKTIRRQMYQTFFAGALAGYVYGIASSTPTSDDELLRFRPGWRDRLNLEGATQVKYLKTLLDMHRWWEWEPDQQILIEGAGDAETLKASCKSVMGNELIIYFADTSAATIDLRKITTHENASATWFDPRNGNNFTLAGAFSTDQIFEFAPPDDWEDAVLILKGSNNLITR